MTSIQISARLLTREQDAATAQWHIAEPPLAAEKNPQSIALQLHRANFDLWHTEDRARDPEAPPEAIVEEKHNIDRYNQQRNDLVESFDHLLLDTLHESSLPNPAAPQNSETPGLMLDRLSILALKIYHTQEEIDRGLHNSNVPPHHAERNRDRLALLLEQRDDLARCMDELWQQVLAGERRFKLYRQMKMYNDPTLNPVLYKAAK
ncbi:MAG TPA: DUF4254 domain-containing protein [Acidobacteriaceae bacterium]